MICLRGTFLLLMLLAGKSKANTSCVYTGTTTATRRNQLTSASDCLFFTMTVTDATPGRKIAVGIDSGSLGPNGICRVYSAESATNFIDTFVANGLNNGIISQPNDAVVANLHLICYQDVPQAVTFSFFAVDTVAIVENIENLQFSPEGSVTLYEPNTLYQWKLITIANDAAAFFSAEHNTHANDLLLGYSDDEQNPIELQSGPNSVIFKGVSVNVQLLTSDSANSVDNHFNFSAGLLCLSKKSTLGDWHLFYNPSCPSHQCMIALDSVTAYVVTFAFFDVPGFKCDIYQGNTTDNFLGTLDSSSTYIVTGTSTHILAHCSTPDVFNRFVIIFDAYDPIPCGGNITLEQNADLALNFPTKNDGYLAPALCEWQIRTPFYLNAGQLLLSNMYFEGGSFLQVTDRYMIESVMLIYQFWVTTTEQLKSETVTTIRMHIDDNAGTIPPFGISVSAICSEFCYSGHAATEHEIILDWSDPGNVPLSTFVAQPRGAFWYTTEFNGCLAQLPTNTWQNVTVTAMGGITEGKFENRLATKPGKMNSPFLISVTPETATIGWPLYTEGDVLIHTYYVNWNGQTISSAGMSAVITSLLPNSIQTVTVQAVNSAGAGRESDPLTVTTEPTAFLNIRSMACPDTTSIVVEYNDVVNDGDVRLLVYGEICWCYDLDDIQTENITGLTHTLTGLLPGRRVVVFTKAIYDDGFVARGPNTIVQPVAFAPSSAPTLVTAEMRQAIIAWEPYNEPGDIVPDEYVITWSDGLNSGSMTVSAQTTDFTFTLPNLLPNYNYLVTLQVKTKECLSPMSPALTVTTLPGPAADPMQILVGESEVSVGWSEPVGGSARLITSYLVQRSFGPQQENFTTDNTTFTQQFNNLVPNTAYPFTITTIYSDGYTTQTAVFYAGTQPLRPDDWASLPTQTTLTVSYSFNNTGNLPVRFSYGLGANPSYMTEDLSFQFDNLIPNSLITFVLFAENDYGQSGRLNGFGETLPPSPTNLSAISSYDQIELMWALPQHGSVLSHQFEVTYDELTAPNGVQSLFVDTLSTIIVSLESNTYYWFQVLAHWQDNSITYSENMTFLTTPDFFAGPDLKNKTQSSLTLQWDDQPGDGDITYTFSVDGVVKLSDSHQREVTITGYSSNYLVSDMLVTACNGAGCQDSAVKEFATDPGSPVFNDVIEHTSSTLTISWDPPTGNAYTPTGYRVQYIGGPISLSDTVFQLTGLSPGLEFTFEIFAIFATVPETSVVETGCTLPGPPLNLMQTGSTSNSVTMQWQDPPSCSNIQYFTVNGRLASARPYSLSNIGSNNAFNVEVIAFTNDGASDSASLIMTTLPGALNVSYSGVTLSTVDLTMTLGGPALGSYDFDYYMITGGGEFNTSSDQFTVTGLAPTSVYNIKVEAVYDGLDSNPMKTVEVHTNPASPRNVNYLIISPTIVNVTWEKPDGGNDIFEYEINWGTLPWQTALTEEVEYQITDIKPNSLFTLSVTTKNNEDTPSVPTSIQMITDPLPADY
uniref:Collagen alpha-1(XII) chain-like n=1 Tax=Phallusia mammillata TaxID=59560 RepID=A0A6F9D9X6_9ASCI|nr:collagen alpha-1(XII) chain-like [Phallusia mammillata]